MSLVAQKKWTFSLAKEKNVDGRIPAFLGDQSLHVMHFDKSGFSESFLFSLDLQTGLENWRFEEPHVLNSPSVNSDGHIFVSSFSGKVFSLNGSGHVRWEANVSNRNLWKVALDGEDRLIVAEIAGQSSATWCLSQATGEVLWHFENGGHSYPVAVRNGVVVHASTQQGREFFDSPVRLFAIDAASGSLKWSTHSLEYLFVPHIIDDVVFIGGRGSVRAYGFDDGELLARHDFGKDDTINRGINVFDNTLIVSPDETSALYSIEYERKRGLFRTSHRFEKRWSKHFSSKVAGKAGKIGEDFFVPLENGTLAFFDLASGDITEFPKVGASAAYAVRDNQMLAAIGRTVSLIEFDAT